MLVKKRCKKKHSEAIAERQARFQALSEKSGDCRRAAGEVEEEIQNQQAGEERRGSCASQSSGGCFEPTMVEQIVAFGAAQTEHFIHVI